jgi:CelD/BcsL family acetyltransferase involved in cellulose biosynthesis
LRDSTTRERPTAEIHSLVEPLAAEWEELAEQTGASPFRRPGWIGPWWRAFGKGALEILTIRRDGRLVAVLPLSRQFGALSSTTNWHTPDFGPVIQDPPALRALAEELFLRAPRRISLAFVDADGPTLRECREAASSCGYKVLTRTLERSPFLLIDGDWQAYEQGLSRNTRGDAKRRIRRLKEAGSMSVEVLDGSERLDNVLAEGFRTEAAGWKGEHGTAIASRRDTESFYREIAHWAAARGWLRLAFLRLDGRPIAVHYSLEHDGVHYLMKVGHDSSYDGFSPGKVLMYEMLLRAFSSELHSYEFLGGDDAWKRLWATSHRERELFQAFERSLPGAIEWAGFRYGRPLARRLSRHWPLTLLRR